MTREEHEYITDWLKRHSEKIKMLEKEIKKLEKKIDKYYSLASCKYRLRNGRELTMYQVLLTFLDRWDRKQTDVKEQEDDTTKTRSSKSKV